MKTRLTIFWMIVLIASSMSAETAKSKTKLTAAKTGKAKTVSKSAQSLGLPKDAYIFKESGKQDAAISTSYKTIVIEGDNNKINIGEGNEKIFVKGKNNDIILKCADYIEITGNDNFISWETTNSPTHKPVIIDKGGYNNVGKRSSGALNKSDN